jgi:hypothetical protein
VPAHPHAGERRDFLAAEPQGVDALQFLAQLVEVELLRQAHPARAVHQGEVHLHLRVVLQHPAGHQELVEVGVEQRADQAGPRAGHRFSGSWSTTPARQAGRNKRGR